MVVPLPDLRHHPALRFARTNCHRGSSVRRLFYPFDHRTIGQAFARLSGASEIPVKQNPKKYKP
jgi:hypothetical protein